jgi:hypothetical protein
LRWDEFVCVKELGYVNPRIEDPRRELTPSGVFRNTFLRMKPPVRKVFVITGWDTREIRWTICTTWSRTMRRFGSRRAAEYGIRFELPLSVSIVANVPKNTAETRTKKAA